VSCSTCQPEKGQGGRSIEGGRAVPADWSAADGAGVDQKSLSCSDACELCKLVDHDQPELSVCRQCLLLGPPRSTLHHRPIQVRESTLWIMARIDALYPEDSCSGSRRIVEFLAREGIPISRNRVRDRVRRMGLRAIYQTLRTTIPGDPSEHFPCLLDLRLVTAVDQ